MARHSDGTSDDEPLLLTSGKLSGRRVEAVLHFVPQECPLYWGAVCLGPPFAFGCGESSAIESHPVLSLAGLEQESMTHSLRICRYSGAGGARAALYFDETIVDLERLYRHFLQNGGEAAASPPDWRDPLGLLPHGTHASLARALGAYCERLDEAAAGELAQPVSSVELLPALAPAGKFFLLAGNYAEHIEEGGGRAEEREHTFPYVFWKPPTTTFRGSGAEVPIPSISPDSVDWEVELGVVIGKPCKAVPASQALECVSGYTVVNDISNRRFRPNPKRRERSRDAFFDWLHGKWFDGSAPVGPAILSAADLPDPQTLELKLRVNGVTHQDSTTAKMIFSVAEIVEFISSIVTLEPGDLISTGTPSGVGSAKNIFLKAGDEVEAEIERIGILRSPMVPEGRP